LAPWTRSTSGSRGSAGSRSGPDSTCAAGGHPVFVAQHATGTCCRSCLRKNHGIDKGAELTPEQQEYVVAVICRWIARELG
jgi:Domain of unknown function (DUF4186)